MSSNYSRESPESVVVHLIDENGWEWRTVVKVINRSFNENYSIIELKQLYKRVKSNVPRQINIGE